MANDKDTMRALLQKKTLLEIETLMFDKKKKMEEEKNFVKLQQLSNELAILQEIREQKQKESGRLVRKTAKPAEKPQLKSYDDYVKSKK
ncbi:MAG: hypothetical protein FWH12_06025 [Treponema sp.]|nr:hypothetical protein [Treponema sp.]